MLPRVARPQSLSSRLLLPLPKMMTMMMTTIMLVSSPPLLAGNPVTASSPQPDPQAQSGVRNPDRDFELRVDFGDPGMSLGVFIQDRVAIELGYGFHYYADYSFLIPELGQSWEDYPVVGWEAGVNASLWAGVAWEQPWRYGLWKPWDSLSFRAGLRYRYIILAKLEGQGLIPDLGVAGTAKAFPLLVGATYSWWLLPSSRPVLRQLSRASDLGAFVRLELGPSAVWYRLYADIYDSSTTLTEPAQVGPLLEFEWSASVGVVF